MCCVNATKESERKCRATAKQPRRMLSAVFNGPVFKGNETYFLAPRIHILFKTESQTTCDRTIPKNTANLQKRRGHYNDPESLEASDTCPTISSKIWKTVSNISGIEDGNSSHCSGSTASRTQATEP
ncbi:PREDICTED: uncharacterized protein LOC105565465 isoform X2 [Vollenhovia emeryi]|nr:PREDICTED: uncharacterized protein LOC105565465 isoform X2 [Vollenhovia emeryi]